MKAFMKTAISRDMIDDMHTTSKERRMRRFPLEWLSIQYREFFETDGLRVVVSFKPFQVNAHLGEIKIRHLITYTLRQVNCTWVAFRDGLIAANFLKPFSRLSVHTQLLRAISERNGIGRVLGFLTNVDSAYFGEMSFADEEIGGCLCLITKQG